MANKKGGSKRISEEAKQRAIVLRRDEKKLIREIVEETGISRPSLQTLFKKHGITVPYRRTYGTPRPNARTARKGKKGNSGNTGKRKKKDESKPEKKKRGDISPVLAMQIEERMRKRREREGPRILDSE